MKIATSAAVVPSSPVVASSTSAVGKGLYAALSVGQRTLLNATVERIEVRSSLQVLRTCYKVMGTEPPAYGEKFSSADAVFGALGAVGTERFFNELERAYYASIAGPDETNGGTQPNLFTRFGPRICDLLDNVLAHAKP